MRTWNEPVTRSKDGGVVAQLDDRRIQGHRLDPAGTIAPTSWKTSKGAAANRTTAGLGHLTGDSSQPDRL